MKILSYNALMLTCAVSIFAGCSKRQRVPLVNPERSGVLEEKFPGFDIPDEFLLSKDDPCWQTRLFCLKWEGDVMLAAQIAAATRWGKLAYAACKKETE